MSSSEDDVPLTSLVKPATPAAAAPAPVPAATKGSTAAAAGGAGNGSGSAAGASSPAAVAVKRKARVLESSSDEDVPLSALTAARPTAGTSAAVVAGGAGGDAVAKAAEAARVAADKAAAAKKAAKLAKAAKKARKKERRERRERERERLAAAKKGKASKRKRDGDGAKKKKAAPAPKAKTAKKRKKQLSTEEKLDLAITAYKWWEHEDLPSNINWETLEHCGVTFSEEYTPHKVKMFYDGEPVELTPEQEEVATWYATVPVDGPHLSKPETAEIFNRNFFRDWLEILGPGHVIKEFEKCDFSPIRAWVQEERERKKAMTAAEKEEAKQGRKQAKLQFGYALVDGHIEKVGNILIEPPGLFRGRGLHPKMGCIKKRVMPEDVTINTGSTAIVPRCPVPGHRWGAVVHDPAVTWLAMWHENIMGGVKYVYLAASSSFKGKSDRDKYEKARKLKLYIDRVRSNYTARIKKKDKAERQLGTAMWIIDVLALRVGNEKDEDEADTVGCCSLRVEHLVFIKDTRQITLDFLGKDSMRYFQTIDFDNYGELGVLVYNNIFSFCQGKKPTADVFDLVLPGTLNKAFTDIMPGLSAKVFRTYNASITLQKELPDMPETAVTKEKEVEYNRANREVAILCNHQRSVPKGFAAAYQKLQDKHLLLRKQLKELRKMAKAKAAGKDVRVKTETTDKAVMQTETHLWKKQPSLVTIKDRIRLWTEKLAAHELNMRNKDDNKEVALGTAKINYMDPRITVAWCKRVECPLERVFAKTLRDKFPWAMSVPPDWEF